MSVVSAQARIIEVDELEKRIAVLEQQRVAEGDHRPSPLIGAVETTTKLRRARHLARRSAAAESRLRWARVRRSRNANPATRAGSVCTLYCSVRLAASS